MEYGGLKFRQADLFNTQTPMAITRQFIRGLRVGENADFFSRYSSLIMLLGS